jgi:hypothetical protein
MMRVAVNWAPYPDGPRLVNQRQAFQRLCELAPSDCQVVLATLPRDAQPVMPVRADGQEIERAHLKRDASEVAHRRLPYMHDMLDVATSGLADTDWGGILNSDIVVTQEFFDIFDRIGDDIQAVICHRTDVLHLDTDPEQGMKVNQQTCTDGVLVRAGLWRERKGELPGYVLGEPYWDTGFIFWTKLKKIPTFHMGNHELLHVRHGRQWSYKSPGCKHNSNLGRWAWSGSKKKK